MELSELIEKIEEHLMVNFGMFHLSFSFLDGQIIGYEIGDDEHMLEVVFIFDKHKSHDIVLTSVESFIDLASEKISFMSARVYKRGKKVLTLGDYHKQDQNNA